METIKRYEMVINEALRSALNYDTPNDQINEFIGFFGKHIGSDRIYIFEDSEERHVTDNTYEWCADGVIPEINELQNVDMDIIDWWYETFSRGESIIITDVEDIKEEHRVSYDMLRAQNVKNVVVCPLYYKDEIRGFFGVDNPPISDYRALTTFLNMIGTLLISFLKVRNSFRNSNKLAKLSSYSSLSKIYEFMYYINVQTGKYYIVKSTDHFNGYPDKDTRKIGEYTVLDDFCGHIRSVVDKMCMETRLEESWDFIDLRTVEERLHGKTSIVHEFADKRRGWCRSRFIPVDYNEEGRLLHVLYCIESIDEEKKRENHLLYLAQTDLMTGLCNYGSGERRINELLQEKTSGLLCLLDCDKFKVVNDTYGHSVGDKVIIAIAESLQKSCRKNDVLLRLGGDEFAIFIPGLLEQMSAEKFFERLFENVGEVSIEEMHGKRVEISLGACFYDGSENVSFDQLYRNADKAMYQSKKKPGYSATIYDGQ
ncbi:GGDEF domain-containing protein [uncultured Eubacterium sp.]|uniref:sensor domain-containing diguanylate cyclase n=1 Tax=uncultured Eubacterium sp. TaxID=165185 RepID=UPI0025D857DD|nr:GGDEF domain-containing protein [uncultured Eubacterium sp.]